MKTAISVPDLVFHRAERQALRLGISRSAFFTHAAERYLAELEDDSTVAAIDAALAAAHGDDSNAVAAAAGRRTVATGADTDAW